MTNASDIEKAGYEQPGTPSQPLRVFRVASGLTQAELADRAGITRITVGALERGENVPQLATARALAAVLRCSPEDLWPNDERRPAEGGAVQESRRSARQNAG